MFGREKTVYTPIPGILGIGEDYHIYKMTLWERITAVGIGVIAGVMVGYVFFNLWAVAVILSVAGAIGMQRPYKNFLQKRRLKKLLLEFKDLLETLTASYSAGQTTV
mgnify:CR=1 FL=1